MKSRAEQADEVFVVRYWAAESGWRGCVHHVPSQRRRFFVRFADLADFMAACLADAGRSADAGTLPSRP